jgi:hypothetical protein
MTTKFKEFQLDISNKELAQWMADAPREQMLRTVFLMSKAAEYAANEMMHHIAGVLDTPEHGDLVHRILEVWPERKDKDLFQP